MVSFFFRRYLALSLHFGVQYLASGCRDMNSVPHCVHVVGKWVAVSCHLLVGGPFDGVASADAEGGCYVVAVPVDVSASCGVVDELIVDADEGFGLAEGNHVWVMHVDRFGGHGFSFS